MGKKVVDWIDARMGFDQEWRDSRFARRNEKEIEVGLGFNIRDLAGYRSADRRHILPWRYLRAGDTSGLDREGVFKLRGKGVRRVLDLRGKLERPELTDVFAREGGVDWKNVPLFDYDTQVELIEPIRPTDNFVTQNYIKLLSDKDNVARAITFLAETPEGACALYHCAAGMDRTGIVSLLLLGSVGVSRREIMRDYGYSLGTIGEINKLVAEWDGEQHEGVDYELWRRVDAIACVYDTLKERFGSTVDYLLDCGVDQKTLKRLERHMLDPRR